MPSIFATTLLTVSMLSTQSQVSEAGAVYADRLTLLSADTACSYFTDVERTLLESLIDRSRDDAIRAGDDPERLSRFEAEYSRAPRDCDSPILSGLADLHRLRVLDMAQTGRLEFPGVYQSWTSVRSRFEREGWAVHQTQADANAVFGFVWDGEDLVPTLAVRREAPPALAMLFIRDVEKQADPIDFSAGGLLPTPSLDPISQWGGTSDALTRFLAAERIGSDSAAQLAPASGEPAFGFAFSPDIIEALLSLTPRESIRIDLVSGTGEPPEQYWFEVGMLKSALAVQALTRTNGLAPAPETE